MVTTRISEAGSNYHTRAVRAKRSVQAKRVDGQHYDLRNAMLWVPRTACSRASLVVWPTLFIACRSSLT